MREGGETPATIAELQEETGLPPKTVERVVEDVVSLRLARREKVSGKWYVIPSRIARKYWDSERSPETSEGAGHDTVQAEIDYYRAKLEVS